MKLLLLLGAVIAACLACGSIHESKPGEVFYRTLPEDEKLDFLIFSLGHGYTKKASKLQRNFDPIFRFPDSLGIDEEKLQKFMNMNYPTNFTTNLYTWIRGSYELDETKMQTFILERKVCLVNGECIDINDVGSLCCPF